MQWLGPRRLTMVIDRYEARDGGIWRYVHREEDGTEYGFHGVFHGTPSRGGHRPDLRVRGSARATSALETLTFERRGDKTAPAQNSVYQTVEARDAMIQSGMEGGVKDGYDRLDELLASGRGLGRMPGSSARRRTLSMSPQRSHLPSPALRRAGGRGRPGAA